MPRRSRRLTALPSSPMASLADGTQNPEAVIDWAENLPDSFLLCRDFGHSWRAHRASVAPDGLTYNREQKCSRCSTERVQELNLYGAILRGYYRHPDGYLAPAGTGHISGDGRSSLRLASTLRLMEQQNQPSTRTRKSA